MRTEHAETAAALARLGTMDAAAHALGVSQSAVGRRIAALESEVGARLFARTPSGTTATAAGRAFLVALPDVLAAAASAAAAVAPQTMGD